MTGGMDASSSAGGKAVFPSNFHLQKERGPPTAAAAMGRFVLGSLSGVLRPVPITPVPLCMVHVRTLSLLQGERPFSSGLREPLASVPTGQWACCYMPGQYFEELVVQHSFLMKKMDGI